MTQKLAYRLRNLKPPIEVINIKLLKNTHNSVFEHITKARKKKSARSKGVPNYVKVTPKIETILIIFYA